MTVDNFTVVKVPVCTDVSRPVLRVPLRQGCCLATGTLAWPGVSWRFYGPGQKLWPQQTWWGGRGRLRGNTRGRAAGQASRGDTSDKM